MMKKRVRKEPPSEDAGPGEVEVAQSMPQESKASLNIKNALTNSSRFSV